jgi:hypothetical protein
VLTLAEYWACQFTLNVNRFLCRAAFGYYF